MIDKEKREKDRENMNEDESVKETILSCLSCYKVREKKVHVKRNVHLMLLFEKYTEMKKEEKTWNSFSLSS